MRRNEAQDPMRAWRRRAGAGALLLAALAFPAPAQAQPVLTVGTADLTATGLTPSGSALWFGVTRVGNGAFTQVSLVEKETAVDVTGWSQLPWDGDLPARSVWVVVDAASGAFAVGVPDEFPRLEEPFVAGEVGQSSEGVNDLLQAPHERLAVLVVRPAVGSWQTTVWDGKESDLDGLRDGVVTAALAAMTPLSGAVDPPSSLVAGDTVVWIDLRQLSFMATSLTTATLGGAP